MCIDVGVASDSVGGCQLYIGSPITLSAKEVTVDVCVYCGLVYHIWADGCVVYIEPVRNVLLLHLNAPQ